jgi:hypothetical protein
MSLTTLLACLALLGSLVMLAQHRPVGFPILALVVSAYEVASAFGLVHLSLGRVPLGLLLGIALLIAGAAVYLRASAKSVISAATTVALVGALQALSSIHLR